MPQVNPKDVAVEAAKMYARQAAKKALLSAGAAIAPYVGIGCLIVLGLFLFVILVCLLFVMILYATCNYAPTIIKVASWLAGIIPNSMSDTAQTLSILGPICDIFKQ